jgi:hypothetical protein
MAPVTLVTIHHEGGGAPSNNVDRFGHGGYCYGIGTTIWKRFRAPTANWATLNFNHKDLTICLSGNRMIYPVSDHDIGLIHGAFMDCYERGEVTAVPTVRDHHDSPGSATACSGDCTRARWSDVVGACRATAPTPPKPPEPEDDVTDLANAKNHDGRPVIFQVGGDKNLYMKIRDAKGGDWSDWRDLTDGFRNFATVTAFENDDKRIEVWVTMVDGKSFSRVQTTDFARWESWIDQTR